MNEDRYSRQTILREFGTEGQKRLHEAKVLVVGAGGLGVPVLTYLNAMGVGTIGIVDNDTVSLTNLHRQVLYDESNIGMAKIKVAIEKLSAQNSDSILKGYETYLGIENALEIIQPYDMVVDATDNFPTRYLINDACVILNKPLVYGALHSFEGQVSVFNYENGPTYRCLFPKMPSQIEIPDCNENGVLGIIPGIIGNLQALEVIKVITGIGEVLSGKLLLYNGLTQNIHKINFPKVVANGSIKKLKPSYDFYCGVVVQGIGAMEFWRLLKKENIQCIDVRSPQEFESYHLPNTFNIPIEEIETRIEEIEMDIPAYFICQSGIRSQRAIIALKELQPKASLINVKGGINTLQEYVA